MQPFLVFPALNDRRVAVSGRGPVASVIASPPRPAIIALEGIERKERTL